VNFGTSYRLIMFVFCLICSILSRGFVAASVSALDKFEAKFGWFNKGLLPSPEAREKEE